LRRVAVSVSRCFRSELNVKSDDVLCRAYIAQNIACDAVQHFRDHDYQRMRLAFRKQENCSPWRHWWINVKIGHVKKDRRKRGRKCQLSFREDIISSRDAFIYTIKIEKKEKLSTASRENSIKRSIGIARLFTWNIIILC